MKLVEFDRLPQAEQMLRTIAALQGTGNGGRTVFASSVTHGRQNVGGPFTTKNGLDDSHARHTGNVRNHVVELQVHLGKRLLHTLNVGSGAPHQHSPLTHIGAKRTNLFNRPESAAKQSVGMQLLRPLAVRDIALSAGNILDLTSINQLDLKPVALKDFKDRNPIWLWIPSQPS